MAHATWLSASKLLPGFDVDRSGVHPEGPANLARGTNRSVFAAISPDVRHALCDSVQGDTLGARREPIALGSAGPGLRAGAWVCREKT
jgi:hypothetical protein